MRIRTMLSYTLLGGSLTVCLSGVTRASEPAPLIIKLEFVQIIGHGQSETERSLGDRAAFRSGDPINVKITYTNATVAPIHLMTCRWGGWDEDNSWVPKKNSNRIIVSRGDRSVAHKEKPGYASCNNEALRKIEPNQSLTDSVVVGSEFDVTEPGVYRVKYFRALETPHGDIYIASQSDEDEIINSAHPLSVSNSITFEVTP